MPNDTHWTARYTLCRLAVALVASCVLAAQAAPGDDRLRQAVALRAQGQLLQSIELLEQSVREAPTERERMRASGELGASRMQARQLDGANDALRKAYQYFGGTERARYAVDLGNLAMLGKRPDEAREFYQEALRLGTADGELALGAELNLVRIAPPAERLRRLGALLPGIARLGQPAARERMYLNLAVQAQSLGQPGLELAFIGFDQARRLSSGAGPSRTQVEALDGLAQLYEDRNRRQEALVLNRQALDAAHAQAAGVVSDLLVSLEWRLARLQSGLNQPELSLAAFQRAADHLESLRQDIPIDYDDGGSSFTRTLEPVYLGLFESLLNAAKGQGGEARTNTLRRARDAVEQIKQAEMQDYLGDRCTVDTVKGGTTTVIPQGTAVLYPVILGDRVELLLETASDMAHVTALVAGDRIRRTAVLFANDLRAGAPGFLPRSQQLYDWLLRPIEAQLAQGNIDTLVVVSDGALRLIPLGALHDGSRYAIEKFAVSTVTGLSMTNTTPAGGPALRFLVAGVSEPGPVVDKLTDTVARDLLNTSQGGAIQVAGLSSSSTMRSIKKRSLADVSGGDPRSRSAALREALALPGVKLEVEAIGRITRTTSLLDAPFTLDGFRREAESGAYRVVHIASHGVFGGTAASSYVLAHDDLLTLDTLQSLLGAEEFRKNPIELLSLSACETAEGDERSPLGLSGAALKARAKSVLGTLWPVEDTAARKSMEGFYGGLVNTRLSKAQALRQSQIDLLRSQEYAHPMFWAPFVLIGNWL